LAGRFAGAAFGSTAAGFGSAFAVVGSLPLRAGAAGVGVGSAAVVLPAVAFGFGSANAGSCGGFDLTTLWGLDSDIAGDMVTVFALIARVSSYPDGLSYEADFKAIVRAWRPELTD